ncbi:MAG: preprotein translocase subunit SecE [Chlamydiales bacterium]|nr:preprotein translocase subunit SecE [Chlamydiales bacterium]
MANKVVNLVSENGKKNSRLNFFYDLKEELKKVSWTSKQELFLCTKVVIGTTFCFGLGIYLVDLVIKGSLDLLNMLVKLVAH